MKNRKRIHSINNGAIADVSFLLLIFFMVVTTFNKDFKLDMTLPPNNKAAAKGAIDKNRLLKIFINGNNEILINDKFFDEDNQFILNEEMSKVTSYSKEAVLQLNIHPESDYKTYLELIAAIKASKKQLLEDQSQEYYNSSYLNLKPEQRAIIQEKTKFKISEKETLPT